MFSCLAVQVRVAEDLLLTSHNFDPTQEVKLFIQKEALSVKIVLLHFFCIGSHRLPKLFIPKPSTQFIAKGRISVLKLVNLTIFPYYLHWLLQSFVTF